MTTDRELDALVAAAAGIDDADLPALPEGFLAEVRSRTSLEGVVQQRTGEPDSASVVAARQLADDARSARTGTPRRRRRPTGRSMVRIGAAGLVAAAALTTAVLLDRSGTSGPSGPEVTPEAVPTPPAPAAPSVPAELPLDPPGGLTLVAATAVTFPYALDPAPRDLTPVLTRSGGLELFGSVEPVTFTAWYRSASDLGFAFTISTRDPRQPPPGAYEAPPYTDEEVVETVPVSIDGVAATFVRADLQSPNCRYAPATLTQEEEPEEVCSDSYADIAWQRSDGLFVYLAGEGDRYSKAEALVAVAESIADRPQPVELQFGLAPQGWAVSSYESMASLTLVSEADPTSPRDRIGISLLERWRGETDPHDALRGMSYGSPVETVTVFGREAALVSVPDPFTGPGFPGHEEPGRMWHLAAQFPDGPLFLLQAPDTMSREDVLAMAEALTYSP
jgi:hypothetical protein